MAYVVNVGPHGDSFAKDQAMTDAWCRLKVTASMWTWIVYRNPCGVSEDRSQQSGISSSMNIPSSSAASINSSCPPMPSS